MEPYLKTQSTKSTRAKDVDQWLSVCLPCVRSWVQSLALKGLGGDYKFSQICKIPINQ